MTDSAPMKLSQVPQILDLLVQGGDLTAGQQTEIAGKLKSDGRFAGKIAVEDHGVPQERLDLILKEQVTQKAEAAKADLEAIAAGKQLTAPAWLKSNWGNAGVAPASAPGEVSAVSAAANMSQNIVMIVKDHPALATNPDILQAVTAAQEVARGINGETPLPADIPTRTSEIAEGLRTAVAESGVEPLDKTGTPIDLETYIAARSTEIQQGSALAAARQVGLGGASPTATEVEGACPLSIQGKQASSAQNCR